MADDSIGWTDAGTDEGEREMQQTNRSSFEVALQESSPLSGTTRQENALFTARSLSNDK
jgi:hypothetical protein